MTRSALADFFGFTLDDWRALLRKMVTWLGRRENRTSLLRFAYPCTAAVILNSLIHLVISLVYLRKPYDLQSWDLMTSLVGFLVLFFVGVMLIDWGGTKAQKK